MGRRALQSFTDTIAITVVPDETLSVAAGTTASSDHSLLTQQTTQDGMLTAERLMSC